MRSLILCVLFFLALPSMLLSVSVSIEFNENQVALGQPFYVQVKVEGLKEIAGSFRMRPSRFFSITGSGISQSHSFVSMGGQMSRQFSFAKNYRFVPQRVGRFSVGPAFFVYKGRTYRTGTATIKVTRRSSIQRPKRNFFSFFDDFSNQRESQKPVVFYSELRVPRKQVYVNELVPLYLDFYMSEPLLQRIYLVSSITKTGFWADEIKKRIGEAKVVYQKGKKWYLYRKLIAHLYPASTGKKTIKNVRAKMYYRHTWVQQKLFSAKGVEVDVLPVPDNGKPADFSGNIGQYSVQLEVSKENVQKNVPFEIAAVVSGYGNIKTVSALTIEYDKKKFRVLTPTMRTVRSQALLGSPAVKRFVYTIYPLQEGKLVLPSISLSYYDPKARQYKRAKIAPTDVTVLPAPVDEKGIDIKKDGLAQQKLVLMVDSIKGRHGLLPFSYLVLLVCYSAGILFCLLAFVWYKRRLYYAQHPDKARKQRAFKGVNSAFKEAQQLLRSGDYSGVLLTIEKKLKEFVLLKLGMPPQSMLLQLLRTKMVEYGISESLCEEYCDLVRQTETMRYGTSPTAEGVSFLLSNAALFLVKLEKAWSEKE